MSVTRSVVCSLGVVGLVVVGLLLGPSAGTAQLNPYCSFGHPGEGAVIDKALNLESRLTSTVRTVTDEAIYGGKAVDEIQVTWAVAELKSEGASCIWIRRAEWGMPGLAEFVVPIDQGSFSVRPVRIGGTSPERACYRFIAMSERAMSEEFEVCVTVENPRLGIPPAAGETPGAPSAGTGLISDEGSGAWVVGFLVVTGTIVLVLMINGRLGRRRG
jgi:hypothetical protein